MKVEDLCPPPGHVQRLYCDVCDVHLELAYFDWEDDVSGVHIRIEGLPVLRCPPCGRDHLPDPSRLALIETHNRALAAKSPTANVKRRKRDEKFDFTILPFVYDPDDYFYIPGLYRQLDLGFFTPVFFNREVLLKYDNSPNYRVHFASTTYGTIYSPEEIVSFGINRHGKLVMWLGDIAKMPEAEQFYLRSENVPSDHAIGSEFYDAQIESKFTPISAENALFQARSNFIEACFEKFGSKVAHLDAEVVTLAIKLNAPLVDTEKERRHVADTLNKIYVESFDNAELGKLMSAQGKEPGKLGGLKRIQGLLSSVAEPADVAYAMSPLYALYDLRVAYSHLTSAESAMKILTTVTTRLGVASNADLATIYYELVDQLTKAFEGLTALITSLEEED
ncbi:hypothetical protein [Phenylobacterium sp.]|uniref:hypothetical protein n=1 Tax=Phenylobacterium sp. TaxID=1871053 RepID=UPI0025E671DC|nr:hypothetical protein [Phenylobacterium sp.]MCA6358104.1 hypothetical protein [Phenylobacterium sp.]